MRLHERCYRTMKIELIVSFILENEFSDELQIFLRKSFRL